jgi:hypothetical protein
VAQPDPSDLRRAGAHDGEGKGNGHAS